MSLRDHVENDRAESAPAREALLRQIPEVAPRVTDPRLLRDLAEAYAYLVSPAAARSATVRSV